MFCCNCSMFRVNISKTDQIQQKSDHSTSGSVNINTFSCAFRVNIHWQGKVGHLSPFKLDKILEEDYSLQWELCMVTLSCYMLTEMSLYTLIRKKCTIYLTKSCKVTWADSSCVTQEELSKTAKFSTLSPTWICSHFTEIRTSETLTHQAYIYTQLPISYGIHSIKVTV